MTALLILVVVMFFNLIIFVHELGHFWAAKWRGLKIDRFQIWFGKPIWKKEINGVQYGLGWIPAGGFVALPQMAPMEAIEGGNREGEPLPPISPLDKIIVAFAGPLFSFLLAFVSAVILWVSGKPVDIIHTTTVGWVEKGSPAEEAGFQRGDRILAIGGHAVTSWNMPLDSIITEIVTSSGERIPFMIERPGVGRMEIVSSYEIQPTAWWQRRQTRSVGISPMSPEGDIVVSGFPDKDNLPAKLAGLKEGDVLVAIDGTPIVDYSQMIEMFQGSEGRELQVTVRRDGKEMQLGLRPVRPERTKPKPDDKPLDYMIGALFNTPTPFKEEWLHPNPGQQIVETLRQMWMTVTSVADPHSSIGIQHLSGPVGIGKIQYFSLLMDHPMHRILNFMVLININLALLNLLPFPVLDGGHITIATMEAIARRPVNVKFLEVLQLAFVFLLFGVMIYVTSKDVFDNFGMGDDNRREIVFPEPGS
ncbi:putative zinc metalloprotease aq_1964 [Haloferula sargassicola]|uniref:Zinc metalloprotease n=2 Tax=Haloferula sargassicola TaxID=490096 RepID=A0ABP9UTX7_9BACT